MAAALAAAWVLGPHTPGFVGDVGQSPVSQQAAAEALPLRDAFAVLCFVSVGMLFEPGFLIREPLLLLCALARALTERGRPADAHGLAVIASGP